jgi:rod shape-determining protein MreD
MDNTKRRKVEENIWFEIRIIAFIVIILLVQRLFLPALFGVPVNVMLLLVVLQVLIEPFSHMARWAFYGGLMLDVLGGTWMGWHAAQLLIAMMVVYLLLARITSEKWILPVVAVFLGGVAYHLVNIVFMWLLISGFSLVEYGVVVFIPELLVLLVPALPVFLLLRWLRSIRRGEVPIDVY